MLCRKVVLACWNSAIVAIEEEDNDHGSVRAYTAWITLSLLTLVRAQQSNIPLGSQ